MPTTGLPKELIHKVFVSNKDDRVTLLTLSKVNKECANVLRLPLLSDLILKGKEDIVALFALLQAPNRTFPSTIHCERLSLINATTIGDQPPASVKSVLDSITVERSLKIHVTANRIPGVVIEASTAWAGITRLALSGGTHDPLTIFNYVGAFPLLRSLQLDDFSLSQAEEETQSATPITFPTSLSRLSTIRSSGVWTFLANHVIPAGGLSGIRHLHIQALFCLEEPGVWDMVQYLGRVRGLETLKLEALYDANRRDLNRDMRNIFQNRRLKLMKISGLRRLQLDFSRVPAGFALETLITHVTFVPYRARNLSVTVDIKTPETPALWDESNPEGQLRQLLLETTPPAGTPASETTGRPGFTLRGFPGVLPEAIRASGNAKVCGYPVVVVEAVGAQVRRSCGTRMFSMRGWLSGLWKRLMNSITGIYIRVLYFYQRTIL